MGKIEGIERRLLRVRQWFVQPALDGQSPLVASIIPESVVEYNSSNPLRHGISLHPRSGVRSRHRVTDAIGDIAAFMAKKSLG